MLASYSAIICGRKKRKFWQRQECMLFMMALSVSSHFNCFWLGWILFLSEERSGPEESLSSCPSPPPPCWGSPQRIPRGPYCGLTTRAFSKWRRTNGDKKGESNGVILSYRRQFCLCFSFLTRSKQVPKRRIYLLYLYSR